MKAVIQRVQHAKVIVANEAVGSIGAGLMVLLGITNDDTTEDIEWICRKITNLRIFDDEQGVMNHSLIETDGEVLLVSQFTLQASTKKGNRPSYTAAARAEISEPLFKECCKHLDSLVNKTVQTGRFGAHMEVSLLNDGPVTILLDSKNKT